MQAKAKGLGDLLVEVGVVTVKQLGRALAIQEHTGERIGKILIHLGYMTEESMLEVLEFQLGVARIKLSNVTIKPEIAASIPVSLAERYQVIPVEKNDKKLKLAMVDPTNFYAIDDVRILTGCEVEALIASEQDIMQAINRSYGVKEIVEKAVNQIKFEAVTAVQTADDAPVISIVNSLISQAVKDKASDIHIEPLDEILRVRFRIDGTLRQVVTFPKGVHAAILSRVKIMSEMDIAEKRFPQDGRIKSCEQGRDIDIRVATLPTIFGEKVVMRILDKQAVFFDINGLGLSKQNLLTYKRLYSRPYGMILVTGPTGSGKTTTLYSTLAAINSLDKNIITIEEPVEYSLEGINQVQINHKAGLGFANGLRSILRQDPDIIMVGEIRDQETADIAIRAALTGHLVFSTLHTNDAAGAITRLIDMGIEPFLVASSVLGVVAQRLVRTICPQCKQQYSPAADSTEGILFGAGDISLYRGTGCPLCGNTGYKGRMAVHEIMTMSSALRDAIHQRVSSDDLKTIAINEGMNTMYQDGIKKALAGLTTVYEVMHAAYAESEEGTDFSDK